MEFKNSLKTHAFHYNFRGKLEQSEEFDVIGQQVSYCRHPCATCQILHWIQWPRAGRGPAAGPEGIMLLQCNIWHVALVLGNN